MADLVGPYPVASVVDDGGDYFYPDDTGGDSGGGPDTTALHKAQDLNDLHNKTTAVNNLDSGGALTALIEALILTNARVANVILQAPSITPEVDDPLTWLWYVEDSPGDSGATPPIPAQFNANGSPYTWSGTYEGEGEETDQHVLLMLPGDDTWPSVYAKVTPDGFVPLPVLGGTPVMLTCAGADFAPNPAMWVGVNHDDPMTGQTDQRTPATSFVPINITAGQVALPGFTGLLAAASYGSLTQALRIIDGLTLGQQYTPVALAVTDISEVTVTYQTKESAMSTATLNADDDLEMGDKVLVVNSSPCSVRTFNGEGIFSDPVPADAGIYITTSDVDGGMARSLMFAVVDGLAFWMNPPPPGDDDGTQVLTVVQWYGSIDADEPAGLGAFTARTLSPWFGGTFEAIDSPLDQHGNPPADGDLVAIDEYPDDGHQLSRCKVWRMHDGDTPWEAVDMELDDRIVVGNCGQTNVSTVEMSFSVGEAAAHWNPLNRNWLDISLPPIGDHAPSEVFTIQPNDIDIAAEGATDGTPGLAAFLLGTMAGWSTSSSAQAPFPFPTTETSDDTEDNHSFTAVATLPDGVTATSVEVDFATTGARSVVGILVRPEDHSFMNGDGDNNLFSGSASGSGPNGSSGTFSITPTDPLTGEVHIEISSASGSIGDTATIVGIRWVGTTAKMAGWSPSGLPPIGNHRAGESLVVQPTQPITPTAATDGAVAFSAAYGFTFDPWSESASAQAPFPFPTTATTDGDHGRSFTATATIPEGQSATSVEVDYTCTDEGDAIGVAIVDPESHTVVPGDGNLASVDGFAVGVSIGGGTLSITPTTPLTGDVSIELGLFDGGDGHIVTVTAVRWVGARTVRVVDWQLSPIIVKWFGTFDYDTNTFLPTDIYLRERPGDSDFNTSRDGMPSEGDLAIINQNIVGRLAYDGPPVPIALANNQLVMIDSCGPQAMARMLFTYSQPDQDGSTSVYPVVPAKGITREVNLVAGDITEGGFTFLLADGTTIDKNWGDVPDNNTIFYTSDGNIYTQVDGSPQNSFGYVGFVDSIGLGSIDGSGGVFYYSSGYFATQRLNLPDLSTQPAGKSLITSGVGGSPVWGDPPGQLVVKWHGTCLTDPTTTTALSDFNRTDVADQNSTSNDGNGSPPADGDMVVLGPDNGSVWRLHDGANWESIPVTDNQIITIDSCGQQNVARQTFQVSINGGSTSVYPAGLPLIKSAVRITNPNSATVGDLLTCVLASWNDGEAIPASAGADISSGVGPNITLGTPGDWSSGGAPAYPLNLDPTVIPADANGLGATYDFPIPDGGTPVYVTLFYIPNDAGTTVTILAVHDDGSAVQAVGGGNATASLTGQTGFSGPLTVHLDPADSVTGGLHLQIIAVNPAGDTVLLHDAIVAGVGPGQEWQAVSRDEVTPIVTFQDIPSGSTTNLFAGLLKASGDMAAGDGSANMPDPSVQGQGVPLQVSNYGSANNIAVSQFGSETIDGDTTVTITPGTSRTFEVFPDENWHTTAVTGG